MSSSLKPIALYAHGPSPNPTKVAILLEELSLPYKITNLSLSAIKQPPFLQINPNGRVPAIEDPNTGVTLWESGAILLYLIETYDHSKTLTYTTTPEKHHLTQWLMFQVSGQGPYFGQAGWFLFFHYEQLPSAQERYIKEIERVTGVLDSWLQTQPHPFLVGDKVTYADLAFVPYAAMVRKTPAMNQEGKLFENGKYAAYNRWLDGLMARPAVRKVLDESASRERIS